MNAGMLYTLLFPQGGFLRASFGESYHVAGANSFQEDSASKAPSRISSARWRCSLSTISA